ncbi:hypothetical protein TNCV_4246671 [Trichonephila clavipes]|nr:hypothetical protein TNCV_4246671 [Trichonephila clavipes]
MKIGNNGNPVLGPFDESTPYLIIFKISIPLKKHPLLSALETKRPSFVDWHGVILYDKAKAHAAQATIPSRGSRGVWSRTHVWRCQGAYSKPSANIDQPLRSSDTGSIVNAQSPTVPDCANLKSEVSSQMSSSSIDHGSKL